MSSTNKTANYELSQFLGSDKPAWLGDYNTDMGKIDAQMKLNADAASGADGKADANATAIGTLANLTTDAKNNIVAAVNEVDAHADAASTTATNATTTANSALASATAASTGITSIENYLALDTYNTYTGNQFTVTSGTGTPVASTEIYVARNSAGTLGKVYGSLQMNSGSTGSTTIKLNLNTGFKPEEKLTIVGAGFCTSVDGTIANANLVINTDGTIELSGYHTSGAFYFRMIACLLFIQNFGDEPQE